jgi:hypothetical protein
MPDENNKNANNQDQQQPQLISIPDREGITTKGSWNQVQLIHNGYKVQEEVTNSLTHVNIILNFLLQDLSKDLPLGSVEFSVLSPYTHLKPHCGPANHKLRLHLGLIIPSIQNVEYEQFAKTTTMKITTVTTTINKEFELITTDVFDNNLINNTATLIKNN